MSQDPVISCISFLARYRIFVFLSGVEEVVRIRKVDESNFQKINVCTFTIVQAIMPNPAGYGMDPSSIVYRPATRIDGYYPQSEDLFSFLFFWKDSVDCWLPGPISLLLPHDKE